MKDPKIAQKAPYVLDTKAGNYSWCTCGLSSKQPFCDGAHREEAPLYRSVKYRATESKEMYFCGCKYSAKMPLCDGSHNNL